QKYHTTNTYTHTHTHTHTHTRTHAHTFVDTEQMDCHCCLLSGNRRSSTLQAPREATSGTHAKDTASKVHVKEHTHTQRHTHRHTHTHTHTSSLFAWLNFK